MNQRPLRLLAKSTKNEASPRPEETLPGHTRQVLLSADMIMCERGSSGLRALDLSEKLFPRLRSIVLLACLMHDLGKASEHYQQMVRHRRRIPQLVRHEALSLWLTWPGQGILPSWLSKAAPSEGDYRLAVLAAAGHHRKFWKDAIASLDSGAGDQVTLFTNHDDFIATLSLAASWCGLPPCPALKDQVFKISREHSFQAFLQRCESETEDWLENHPEDGRLLAAAKAFVIAADVAGSCIPRSGQEIGWIREHFRAAHPRNVLEKIVGCRLGGASARPFQEATAASTSPVTLLTAGCGSGKTIAAYLWGLRRHPERSLWIAYPTTGTATEGFRDYIWDADVDGLLEHSRAEIDIEILSREEDESETRTRDRFAAIRAWGSPVVTCTVDTIIGLLQNQRKGLYAWPALCHAALVFDEIHSYDDALFGLLLRLIESLRGIPILLMTATLPEARLHSLAQVTERVHGAKPERICGPEELETLPRYFLDSGTDARGAWRKAASCLDEGGKVLWVANTVERCLQAAREAEARGLKPFVYHSRFRYIDRVERHREIVAAFKDCGSRPTFAITTQVAEMSLDLSADLLVTELAPVWALIQRLGRLNRRATAGTPPKPFVVLPPPDPLPYTPEDLDEASSWLRKLSGRSLSQRDLVQAWVQKGLGVPTPARSEWLDGGFSTYPAPVRQATPGLDIILPEDAPAIRHNLRKIEEVVIPMPPLPPSEWMTWQRVGSWYPVPPKDKVLYDPKLGASWVKPS